VSVRVQWDGLNEFRNALKNLPEELRSEATVIVGEHAREAQRQVIAAYPQGPTGNLKRGVTAPRNESTQFMAKFRVRSQAPHAHIFEYGTKERRTRSGANRGVMPKAPSDQAAVPFFIRQRRRMLEALIVLVRQAGFQVSEL